MAAPIQQLAQRQKIYLAEQELGSYPVFTLQGITQIKHNTHTLTKYYINSCATTLGSNEIKQNKEKKRASEHEQNTAVIQRIINSKHSQKRNLYKN